MSIAIVTQFITGCGGSSSRETGSNAEIDFNHQSFSSITILEKYDRCLSPIDELVRVDINPGNEEINLFNQITASSETITSDSGTQAPLNIQIQTGNTFYNLIDVPHGDYTIQREKLIPRDFVDTCSCPYIEFIVENGSENTQLIAGDGIYSTNYWEAGVSYFAAAQICEPDFNSVYIVDFDLGLYQKLEIPKDIAFHEPLRIAMESEMKTAPISSQSDYSPSFGGAIPHPDFGDSYVNFMQNSVLEDRTEFNFMPNTVVPNSFAFHLQRNYYDDSEKTIRAFFVLEEETREYSPWEYITVSNHHNSLSPESDVILEAPNINPIDIYIREENIQFTGLSNNSFDLIHAFFEVYTFKDGEGEKLEYHYFMNGVTDALIFDEWVTILDNPSFEHAQLRFSFLDFEDVYSFANAARYLLSDVSKTSSFTDLSVVVLTGGTFLSN